MLHLIRGKIFSSSRSAGYQRRTDAHPYRGLPNRGLGDCAVRATARGPAIIPGTSAEHPARRVDCSDRPFEDIADHIVDPERALRAGVRADLVRAHARGVPAVGLVEIRVVRA